MTASAANYNQLDGHDLKDGTFVTTANKFRGDAAPFDTESVTMNLRSNTVGFWANVGVSDEFELSVVSPGHANYARWRTGEPVSRNVARAIDSQGQRQRAR